MQINAQNRLLLNALHGTFWMQTVFCCLSLGIEKHQSVVCVRKQILSNAKSFLLELSAFLLRKVSSRNVFSNQTVWNLIEDMGKCERAIFYVHNPWTVNCRHHLCVTDCIRRYVQDLIFEMKPRASTIRLRKLIYHLKADHSATITTKPSDQSYSYRLLLYLNLSIIKLISTYRRHLDILNLPIVAYYYDFIIIEREIL